MVSLLQACDRLKAFRVSGLQHRQGMHGNVRTGRGMGCWREIIGIGFAFDLEDGHGDGLSQLRFGGEPLRCCPAVHHLFGETVVCRQLHQFVEGVVHEQGAAQALSGTSSQLFIAVFEELNQGGDVVPPHHCSKQTDRFQR